MQLVRTYAGSARVHSSSTSARARPSGSNTVANAVLLAASVFVVWGRLGPQPF